MDLILFAGNKLIIEVLLIILIILIIKKLFYEN